MPHILAPRKARSLIQCAEVFACEECDRRISVFAKILATALPDAIEQLRLGEAIVEISSSS